MNMSIVLYKVELIVHDPYITDDPPLNATNKHQITSQRPSQNGRWLWKYARISKLNLEFRQNLFSGLKGDSIPCIHRRAFESVRTAQLK